MRYIKQISKSRVSATIVKRLRENAKSLDMQKTMIKQMCKNKNDCLYFTTGICNGLNNVNCNNYIIGDMYEKQRREN